MMGTYDQLMQLDQAKPARSARPEKSQPAMRVSPMGKRPAAKQEAHKAEGEHDTRPSRNHATTTPRYHDTIVETIRTAVKVFGKEAATHRFTLAEKKAVRDIVYTYEGQGIKTNENEISRIGVNFLIEDYRQNGSNSVLHRVLQALNG